MIEDMVSWLKAEQDDDHNKNSQSKVLGHWTAAQLSNTETRIRDRAHIDL